MTDSKNNAKDSEHVGEIVSIFRRGNVWWSNFQLNGQQHRQTLKTKSKKEARRKALLLFIPVVLVLATLYFLRVRQSLASPEVQTVRAQVSQPGQASTASAVLTASGYVVARRKAVVSAKIQGRLAELKVEEGSKVREGEVIARLESIDYEAQVARAKAQVQIRDEVLEKVDVGAPAPGSVEPPSPVH